MYTLRSNRLRVDISEPGEAPNVTSRFDRAGFIDEVVLDGLHRFCASEPLNLEHKSSGGRGICSEYISDFDKCAPVGEYFLKPGVGLLLKEDDEPYRLWKSYKTRELNHETVESSESALRIKSWLDDFGGYAYSQEKAISIAGNRMEMRISLTNAGKNPLQMDEYCHNFLTVRGMSVGPDYRLQIPGIKAPGNGIVAGAMKWDGKGFTFTGHTPKPMFHLMPAEEFSVGGAFSWSLENTAACVRVVGEDKIDLGHVAIWVADHMFSLEAFHKIALEPGQSCEWTRSWAFEAD